MRLQTRPRVRRCGYTRSSRPGPTITAILKMRSRPMRCSTISASTGSPTPPHRRPASTGRTTAPAWRACLPDGSNCQWRRRSFRTRSSARQRPGQKRYGRTRVLWMTTADAGPLSIALPGARAFPESITSARDGTLFIGRLGDGGIIRANPRTGKASLFVAAGASGSRSITGVFADEASKTLWACSNDLSALGGPSGGRDRGSALKGFDLRTSAPKLSVPLPGPNAFCNDIAVDARGAAYLTDSAAPNVLRLPARASPFDVFSSNPQFLPPKAGSAGLDGIAFGGDGHLYVTTYAAGRLV